MKIAIIEDELPALNRLKKIIAEVIPDAVLVFTADSIESAVSQLTEHKDIELALFDIELADGQSFEIFNRIQVTCPIIFTTAYDEFALKAFKLNSIDYLLKPIDKDELSTAITKYRTLRYLPTHYQTQLKSLIETLGPPQPSNYKARFLLKNGTKLISIATKEIAYFQAADKVVYVVLNSEQRYIIDHSLDELCKLLDPNFFFQLNRQFIVNVDSIGSIHNHFNGKLKVSLKPKIKEEVLVSREKASEFKKWLDR
jgi:two-component system, LytTR family, response regulator LytT